MQTKEYKVKNEATEKRSIFSLLEQAMTIDKLAVEGLPVKFIPYILFVTVLSIFYIGNNHYTEKTIRKINVIEAEVEELRADYTSLKAEYMFDSKQSEVAKKVKPLGLEESLYPPVKILVEPDEY